MRGKIKFIAILVSVLTLFAVVAASNDATLSGILLIIVWGLGTLFLLADFFAGMREILFCRILRIKADQEDLGEGLSILLLVFMLFIFTDGFDSCTKIPIADERDEPFNEARYEG